MTVESALTKDYTWITKHVILLLLTAALIAGAVYGVDSLIAKHDAVNSTKWTEILNGQVAQTKVLQQQLASDEAQWQKVQSQLISQNASLENAIEKQNQRTQKQQQSDQNLSIVAAASRLNEQTKAQSGEITAQGDSVVLDLPITRNIVGNLDLLSGTQDTLLDTQKQLNNETSLYNGAKNQISDQNKLVTAQQNQLTDAQKTCDARISTVKAQNRKNVFKWVLTALGVGIGIGAHYL